MLLFLLTFFCGIPMEDKPDESRRVYDNQKVFSVIPPKGWDKKPDKEGPNVILSRIGPVADVFSNFNARKVVSGQEDISLKDLAAAIKQHNQRTIPQFEVFEEKELTIDGKPAYVMFTGQEVNIGTGKLKTRAGSYMIQADKNTTYIVTYTILPAAYYRLKPLVEASANTIKIKK